MLEVRQISDFEDSTASDVILALGIATGGCPPPARADGRWSIGDRTMGAIVCYRDNLPASIIDWSYDDDRILARADRPGEQPVALFDWWLANAGTISR